MTLTICRNSNLLFSVLQYRLEQFLPEDLLNSEIIFAFVGFLPYSGTNELLRAIEIVKMLFQTVHSRKAFEISERYCYYLVQRIV